MLYSLTAESAAALSKIMEGASEASVEITEASIRINLSFISSGTKAKAKKKASVNVKPAPEKSEGEGSKLKPHKPRKGARYGANQLIEYEGEAHTQLEWAKKLGITPQAVSFRLKTHGNPMGKSKPTDKDKIAVS